jgi:hypothetical protein
MVMPAEADDAISASGLDGRFAFLKGTSLCSKGRLAETS